MFLYRKMKNSPITNSIITLHSITIPIKNTLSIVTKNTILKK